MKSIVRKGIIFAVTMSLVMSSFAPASADTADENNLLKNPSFESFVEEGGILKATDWKDPDGLWGCVEFHDGWFPVEGKYFIWPSVNGCEKSYIYQDVDITAIPAGTWMELSGYLSNYDQSPNDEAVMTLEFRNANNKIIKSYKRSQRNPKWICHRIQAKKPEAAVKIRVRLTANRYVGYNNDAYFDNLCLKVMGSEMDKIFITGNAKTNAGKTVKLTANNGKDTNPANYTWSSSYDEWATVDASGNVKLTAEYDKSIGVVIYAVEKATGQQAAFYFGTNAENELPVAKVAGLAVKSKTKTTITLKWNKSEGANGYMVYRYNAKTKKYVKIKTLSSGSAQIKVAKLKKNTLYKFKVVAYAAYGTEKYNAPASKILTVRTKK